MEDTGNAPRGNPDELAARAGELLGRGMAQGAARHAGMALEADPGHLAAIMVKGAAAGRLGRNEEAMACWDAGLAIAPSDPGLLSNKAATLGMLGRADESVTCAYVALRFMSDGCGIAGIRGSFGHKILMIQSPESTIFIRPMAVARYLFKTNS